ncbi:MAG: hypothetical protein A3H57_01015 [Candidatus Taylorbacteria bacterium RIFCSPLOWO2_02_FULL_43_11]|uniref:Uncharacterized protein n=1 Tax=Candidatus Taylorbacteria bacterium RIFCSPHIGHO2_02_FULL_43_32b TaxID=1802306 RepID=A0A1G2MJN2_9BACT|nr:MAG: hypothetical protein A2743_02925 [Candidatus Taylorbacteria bacterium RIFCSPHIGHO2_01_FULL_43_47]OHA23231.1 MAG: hypothetical protein A3C72_01890 [Candidatus Taylorbacteria bacterium RIFCSPHIGHO2_02_FULL_43_32b]OHA30071.1 MAG: hypothetical protein A3B08_00035 [Candidatus Taylorbacteria bacterium RIFCSPLOWO2_01_FULL_43_44]OHA35947.1 MAG: hypothetical protein A3H57_01015 [Candidatus Taylorbacteria bacterium RIFCSPLOWO2_02_FULL_43_11]
MGYTQEEFTKIVERVRGEKGVDLSMAEDLSIAVMNLISLEEHFFFTAEKTGKDNYFDSANEIREVRKVALKTLVGTHEGETWCATKHLLAATMRLIEVGTKLQSDGKKDEAKKMFDNAYKVYSIFWALRLKLIEVKDVALASKKDEKPWTTEDLVTKLADCCKE